MDYGKATECLNSGNVFRQLSCLIAASSFLQEYTPTDSFYCALIENGLASEDDLVREVAFRCIFVLYGQQSYRWADVRAAVMQEMSTADRPKSVRAALSVLNRISLREQLLFLGSKEGISAVISSCTSDNLDTRAACVTALTPLLVDLWMHLDGGLNPEGVIQELSSGDAKRFAMDFKDMCLALFKQFTSGLLGKSDLAGRLSSSSTDVEHPGCLTSYFSAIGHLLSRYNDGNLHVTKWVCALLGQCDPVSAAVSDRADKAGAAALYPLVKIVVPRLCSDPYLLISKWENICMSTDFVSGGVTSDAAMLGATSCLSGLFIAICHSLPWTSSDEVKLATGLPPIMEFDAGTHNAGDAIAAESASSRQGDPKYLDAVALINEWVTVHLAGLLKSPFPDVFMTSMQAIMELTHHPSFTYARYKISPQICSNAIRVLKANTEVSTLQSINPLGLKGWFYADSDNLIASNGSNAASDNPAIEFSEQLETFVAHLSAKAVPVFTDDTLTATSGRCLPALGAGTRGAAFFQSNEQSRGVGCAQSRKGLIALSVSSPVSILCAYVVFACRFVPRLLTAEPCAASILTSLVVCMNAAALKTYSGEHITQSRLVAEVAMLVLTDPAKRGAPRSAEFVKSFLNSNSVAAILTDASSHLRHYLVTALCRAYVRIMPVVIVTLINKHEASISNSTTAVCYHCDGTGRWASTTHEARPVTFTNSSSTEEGSAGSTNKKSRENVGDEHSARERLCEKAATDAKADLENFLQCGLILLLALSPCLSWDVATSLTSDAAALQYIYVMAEISRVVWPSESSTIGPLLSISADDMNAINKWAGSLLSERVESMLWLLNSDELCSTTVRDQLCIVLAQLLSRQYGATNPMVVEKGTEILDAVKRGLFQHEEKAAAQKAIMDSALSKGRLGLIPSDRKVGNTAQDKKILPEAGSVHEYHPSGNSCRQIQAIIILEFLALHNRAMTVAVLDTLKDFHKLFQIQALSPVLKVSPYYHGGKVHNVDDITLRGRMSGWSVATAGIVQRSYIAYNRILVHAPELIGDHKIRDVPFGAHYLDASSATEPGVGMNYNDSSNASEAAKVMAYTTGVNIVQLEKKIVARVGGSSGKLPVRSVFRWLCDIGSSPACSDIGLERSFFSCDDTISSDDIKSSAGLGRRKAGCVADVIAVVDDVQNGHLLSKCMIRQGSDKSRGDKTLNGYLSDVLFTSPDIIEYSAAIRQRGSHRAAGKLSSWTVLSGSSDVLTVMGCVVLDRFRCTGIIKCLVINSSGFQIPCFSIQPVLSTPIPAGVQSQYSSVANFRINQLNVHEACTSMIPGAIVERTWECSFRHCYAETLVTFNVIYTNLNAEDEFVEDPCFELFSTTQRNESTSDAVAIKRHHSSASLTAAFDVNTNNHAHIHSRPLAIRPIDILMPYGGGSLDCMSRFATHHTESLSNIFGIPSSVFKSMRTRMSIAVEMRKINFLVDLPEGLLFQNAVNDALKWAENSEGGSSCIQSLCARVSLPCECCASPWGKQFNCILAWCFQSGFGDEVCMTLTTSASNKKATLALPSSVVWECSLDIRSSNDDLSKALIRDSSGTLRFLLGEIPFSLNEDSPRVLPHSFSVPTLKSHVKQQEEEADHRREVIEQARLAKEKKAQEEALRAKESTGVKSSGGFSNDPFQSDPFGFSEPVAQVAPLRDPFSDDIFAMFDSSPATSNTLPASKPSAYVDDILGLFISSTSASVAGASPPGGSRTYNPLGFSIPSATVDLMGSINGGEMMKMPLRAFHLPPYDGFTMKMETNTLLSSIEDAEGNDNAAQVRNLSYSALRSTTWRSNQSPCQ